MTTSRRFDDAPRAIARLQRELHDLRGLVHARLPVAVPGMIDMDEFFSATNSSTLSATFLDLATFAYTPPASWGTYRLKVVAHVNVANTGLGDNVGFLVQVDGNNGPELVDNIEATDRHHLSHHQVAGLSGAVNIIGRIRNTSSNTGVVVSTWYETIAVQEP